MLPGVYTDFFFPQMSLMYLCGLVFVMSCTLQKSPSDYADYDLWSWFFILDLGLGCL